MSRAEGTAPARAARAFTLLEVMAAVAMFGLVYVLIARAAIDGLGVEGDAQRRLRASLLADRALAEIEAGVRAGVTPRLGRSEFEEGDYAVSLDVDPLDPAALGLETLLTPPPEGSALTPSGRSSIPSLFARTPRGGSPPLLTVQLRVTWAEGATTQQVTRTTFLFDPLAAAPLLEGLPGPGDEAGPGRDSSPPPAGDEPEPS